MLTSTSSPNLRLHPGAAPLSSDHSTALPDEGALDALDQAFQLATGWTLRQAPSNSSGLSANRSDNEAPRLSPPVKLNVDDMSEFHMGKAPVGRRYAENLAAAFSRFAQSLVASSTATGSRVADRMESPGRAIGQSSNVRTSSPGAAEAHQHAPPARLVTPHGSLFDELTSPEMQGGRPYLSNFEIGIVPNQPAGQLIVWRERSDHRLALLSARVLNFDQSLAAHSARVLTQLQTGFMCLADQVDSPQLLNQRLKQLVWSLGTGSVEAVLDSMFVDDRRCEVHCDLAPESLTFLSDFDSTVSSKLRIRHSLTSDRVTSGLGQWVGFRQALILIPAGRASLRGEPGDVKSAIEELNQADLRLPSTADAPSCERSQAAFEPKPEEKTQRSTDAWSAAIQAKLGQRSVNKLLTEHVGGPLCPLIIRRK